MWLWDFIRTILIIILGAIGCMVAAIFIGGFVVFIIAIGSIVAIGMGIAKGIVYIIERIQGI